MSDVLNLINSLGEKEKNIKKERVISPVFQNREIIARIDGIVCRLRIPKVTDGWWKFKPRNLKSATVDEEASFFERDQYLQLMTKVRMVLVYKKDGIYFGVPQKNNKIGLSESSLVPIYLVSDDEVQSFSWINARFDGANFWYQEPDFRSDPSKADYLRKAFEDVIKPDKIRYSGLTVEEKIAYTLRYQFDDEAKKASAEYQIQKDVEFAGGSFVRYVERNDHYSVTYKVGRQQYTSYVTKDASHHVLTAGICLSGHDRDYDLTSLITVLKEGQRRGLIYRFNNTTG